MVAHVDELLIYHLNDLAKRRSRKQRSVPVREPIPWRKKMVRAMAR
jgi:hypothetical protein